MWRLWAYQVECPLLERKKKSVAITLSGEESSSDSDGENFGRFLISCVLKNESEVIETLFVLKSCCEEDRKTNPSQLKYDELLLKWGRRSKGYEAIEGKNTSSDGRQSSPYCNDFYS